VLKSELANFQGGEACARDLLLCLLHMKTTLTSQQLQSWVQAFRDSTTPQARDEMARSVGYQDKSGCFRLKNNPDQDFISRFPDLVAEFAGWWTARRTSITAEVKAGGSQGSAQQAEGVAIRNRSKLTAEVREALLLRAMSFSELRKFLQGKNQIREIKEEELLAVLNSPELDAAQVKGIWVLVRTGTEANDQFRKTLLGLFRNRDSVTKQQIMEEFEKSYGEECQLSDYVVRQQLREMTEKKEDERSGQTVYVVKGSLQTR